MKNRIQIKPVVLIIFIISSITGLGLIASSQTTDEEIIKAIFCCSSMAVIASLAVWRMAYE